MADAHAHSHTHEHGHAHAQHHHHHDHGDEYLEQLFTIGLCGAFGAVAVALAVPTLTSSDPASASILRIILHPDFHPFVLVAGIVLLAMTLIRVLSLWQESGAHAHHDHGPDCNHGTGCGHDHGHGDHDHSHGGVYWRAVVLLFPIVLFIWGQPNQGYSADWLDTRTGGAEIGPVKDVAAKAGGRKFSFDELNAFANNAEKRESEEGKTATVKGQIRKLGDREATLYRLKMTCCAADTIPLKARIITDNSLGGITDHSWVEVTGQLQFVPVPGSSEYMPLLKSDPSKIKTKGVQPE